MRLPVIQGVIRRRILVNFRIAPDVMQTQLPTRFRPKLQDGHAIAGICLIRLEAIRPRLVPTVLGLSSENAAHRIAVVWEDQSGELDEGVLIPRRDTDSLVSSFAGGRLFPGEHHRARFEIAENAEKVDVRMESNDGEVSVRVVGHVGGDLPQSSTFGSLSEASTFFERGSLGYSTTSETARLDGLELRTKDWHVEALQVDDVQSSYFDARERFPPGTVEFDCALAMRNVFHEWHSAEDLYV